MTGTPRAPRPLVVAATAYAAGGLGNVAFSLHDGTQAGLALSRFAIGYAATALALGVLRPQRPALRDVEHAQVWVHAAAISAAAAVIAAMYAATHTSALTLTLIGALSPSVTAAGGRLVGAPVPTRTAALWAAVAVLAGTAATIAGHSGGTDTPVGVALAVLAMLFSSTSALTSAVAASARHPLEIGRAMCAWGTAGVAAMVAAGAPLAITLSTVVVAAVIAVVMGVVAKSALWWANARTSPALVEAAGAIATVTAAAGGVLLLDQSVTPAQAVLCAVALCAVVMLARTSRTTR